jgi:hypothetical protein
LRNRGDEETSVVPVLLVVIIIVVIAIVVILVVLIVPVVVIAIVIVFAVVAAVLVVFVVIFLVVITVGAFFVLVAVVLIIVIAGWRGDPQGVEHAVPRTDEDLCAATSIDVAHERLAADGAWKRKLPLDRARAGGKDREPLVGAHDNLPGSVPVGVR